MKITLHKGIPVLLLAGFLSLFRVDVILAADSGASSELTTAEITGTITDGETGEPLPGANILIKGSSTGTVADFDGNFSINANEGDVLIFSYTGYQSQEITVGAQTKIDVVLSSDAELLGEVVVVGYGIQKKRDVTASIASLNEEQIKAIPVPNTVQAMQGQVAGVDIQQTGGRPGQNPTIRIRGRRSINASNEPLYVIDGIPQTSATSAVIDINPQDIESVEILKDAAATAIYGSRGANGVVIITTKRGSIGRTVVAYNGYYGITEATSTVDMMNGEQFAAMKRESRRRDANGNAAWNGTIPGDDVVFDDPIELESLALGRSTDYQDLVLQNGWQTNHQLSVSGGTENTQFNISLGYFDEQGIIESLTYQRFTARANLDQKIGQYFSAGISFLASRSTQDWGSNATLGEAISNNPLGVPYDEMGNLLFLPTNDGIRTNPLSELVPGAFEDERVVTRIFAPFYLKARPFEGLEYTMNFGPDIRFRRQGRFRGSLTNANRGGPPDAQFENNEDFGYTLENIITYNKTFAGENNFKLTLLQSIQSLRVERHESNVSNLPYETQLFYNIGTSEVIETPVSRLTEWSLASFMGRVNYDYKGKYLFQATLRADGSSRLAEGNKWEYFPGISVGWQIGEEPFLSDVNFINQLKLRASYGEVGNTSVNPYQTAGRLRQTTYAWDESPAFGWGLNEIPNPNLGWEVSSTIDIGFDFDLFNGRIAGSFDWYRTQTNDILLERNLPFTSGYQNVLQNIGSTETRGVELGLDASIIDNPNGFRWSVNFNISSYTEEIVELALKDEDGNPIDDVGSRLFIGEPLRVFFDYRKIGIWQANEADMAEIMEDKEPGEIKLEDVNGDGIITPDDRVVLGTDIPDFLGGITNRFEYKGLDFSFFFFFRQGQMILSNFHEGNNSLFARYNNLNVDYWTIDNPTNAFPRPNENQERPRNDDTMAYFDGSFVKLRNVTLGYNFPTNLVNKWGISSMRFYLSGQNLWFLSDYETFDPEVDTPNQNSIPEAGSGDAIIPSNRLFLAGVNVTF